MLAANQPYLLRWGRNESEQDASLYRWKPIPGRFTTCHQDSSHIPEQTRSCLEHSGLALHHPILGVLSPWVRRKLFAFVERDFQVELSFVFVFLYLVTEVPPSVHQQYT